MIVGKYAYYEVSLLQPIVAVTCIEKYRPQNRNSNQSNMQESFASLFQKATQNHADKKKQSTNTNGFDVIC